MASGLAVVVFDSAAASLLVRNGENGALIAPSDPDAFVKAAVRLAAEPELRRHLGEAARSRVQPLSWNVVVADFESAIRKTISGKLAQNG